VGFSGVPQGAVHSPTLLNIFTSNFPTLTDVQLALFADDLALFSTYAKVDVIMDRLQLALNTIKRYYSTWRIKLNPSKTRAVFFTKRKTRELPTSDLSLDGYYIPWSDRAKYLGLILDKKLTFSPHFSPHFVSAFQQEVHSFFGPKIASLQGNFSAYHSVLICGLAWMC
jgi:hypothetical protein